VKILIDMNLSPRWVDCLGAHGIEAVHWNICGEANTPDSKIMSYAEKNGFAVFTCDLDFSAMLAATEASRPSIIQLRDEDTCPETYLDRVVDALIRYAPEIEAGTIITISPHRTRVHILPFSLE
jgi:predicted nuclease of predicted toxin-antitoxin system